jgi:hypothetical protein
LFTAVVSEPFGRPVRLAYQPPASSTFLSEQTSHQPPAKPNKHAVSPLYFIYIPQGHTYDMVTQVGKELMVDE